MKTFNLLLVVCLVAGSQASFLDTLGDIFTQVGSGLVTTAKAVGDQLLDQLKTTAVTLASTAVGPELLQEAAPVMQKLNKAVMDHNADQKMLLGLALQELEKIAIKMTERNDVPVTDILRQIDEVVHGHAETADLLVQALKEKVTAMGHHKRSLLDSLSQVGTGLASAFQPQIDTLKGLVSDVGSALKQAALGLFHSLTQTVTQLGTQLLTGDPRAAISDSGSAIANEGQNALDSLKSAVSDIFQQTMTNIQPHLNNIMEHGRQALTEGAGQLATNLLIHSLTSGKK